MTEPPMPWFAPTVPRPAAQLTLVAFPQAGGGVATFTPHARLLPEWIEVRTLNLPGRQARFCTARAKNPNTR